MWHWFECGMVENFLFTIFSLRFHNNFDFYLFMTTSAENISRLASMLTFLKRQNWLDPNPNQTPFHRHRCCSLTTFFRLFEYILYYDISNTTKKLHIYYWSLLSLGISRLLCERIFLKFHKYINTFGLQNSIH